MKIKFFKIKKSFKKGGLHTNPDVFWNLLQGVALAVVFGSVFFGFLLFQKINKEFAPLDTIDNSSVTAVSKERVDKILEYFSGKANKSNEILNSPSPIVDPSK